MPAGNTPESDAGVIHSASVAQLVDAGAENLVNEINRTLSVTALAPLAIGAGVTATAAASLLCATHHWGWGLLALLLLGATIWSGKSARARDLHLKTVRLWFDLSAEAGSRFKTFEDALERVASCSRVWRIATEEATGDWKRNAGAGTFVTRTPVSVVRRLPPHLRCNLRPFSLPCGNQMLYFFPDQILVYEGSRAGAVSYGALEVDAAYTRFPETESVPGDATVIDHTWSYVNRNGGPDRRFSDNAQIPVCRYQELILRSASGLNIHLMLSHLGVADEFKRAEAQLIPLTREAPHDADQSPFDDWVRSHR